MAHYIVRETVTLLYYVEADSAANAIEKAKENGLRDFDEVDCTGLPTDKIEAAPDPDYAHE